MQHHSVVALIAAGGLGTAVCASVASGAGPVDEFTIGLEEIVEPGVPGPGAGELETPGAVDIYTLTIDEETAVWFDELSGSSFLTDWRCEDSRGGEVFAQPLGGSAEPGLFVLPADTYTITVEGDDPDDTGTYSFIVWAVNDPELFEIGLKEIVADGAPGPGAGVIEEPGALDIYTLEIAAETTVYFDELSGNPIQLQWRCLDGLDNEIFAQGVGGSAEPGAVVLPADTYTIEVFGNGDGVGSYSFTVSIINEPEFFDIGLKEIVAEGTPGPGAGVIEEAGAVDVYTLTVAAETTVYFDELIGNPLQLAWRCEDSAANEIFEQGLGGSGEPGVIVLPADTYTIEVFGNGDGVGSYSFTVLAVNPPEFFDIALNETVEEGVPGPGAGVIEEPAAIDVYTLVIPFELTVFFDELAGNALQLRWRCEDSAANEIFEENLGGSGEPGSITLPADTYTITVFGNGDGVGSYSFVVLGVSAVEFFDIAVDQPVSLDTPAPGAGEIDGPGAIDVYTLAIEAPVDVCFDEQLGSPLNLTWSAFDPDGVELFTQGLGGSGQPGGFALDVIGAYTIVVQGQGDGVGEYAFTVRTAIFGDFDCDGVVAAPDLAALLAAWGECDECPEDLDGDGAVGPGDLATLLANWG